MSTDLEQLANFMREQELTLVTAESCTAGLIAARLADVPGAGALLDCAFVTYSKTAKQRCLGVRKETLARFNLTSPEVAREMALGAIACSRANVAISNTGVTDDTDPQIEPGTQCFAWIFRRPGESDRVFNETVVFSGSRNDIREQAATYALSRIPHYHGASL